MQKTFEQKIASRNTGDLDRLQHSTSDDGMHGFHFGLSCLCALVPAGKVAARFYPGVLNPMFSVLRGDWMMMMMMMMMMMILYFFEWYLLAI